MKAANPEAGRAAVDEYIERVPEPGRTTLTKVRTVIRRLVPPETTEAIGYGLPTFRYKGMLLAYGAFKGHCGLFIGSAAVMRDFSDELAGYSTSKGTLRFGLDSPLPATLLKKLVKARLAEKDAKKPKARSTQASSRG